MGAAYACKVHPELVQRVAVIDWYNPPLPHLQHAIRRLPDTCVPPVRNATCEGICITATAQRNAPAQLHHLQYPLHCTTTYELSWVVVQELMTGQSRYLYCSLHASGPGFYPETAQSLEAGHLPMLALVRRPSPHAGT